MKKVFAILLTVSFIFTMAFPALAAEDTEEIQHTIVISEDEMNEDAGYYIETALQYARDHATADHVVSVYVPSGRYELSRTLHIYSNTRLILQKDTYLKKTFSDGNMLKCGVMDEINFGYGGYRNMTIYGGIWDGDYNGNSCAMRFAHCRNVRMNHVVIRNIRNSHHMELAGADDFSIVNCRFSGYQRTNSGDGEAIQIDVLHNSYHFPAYEAFDDTPCRNITVRNCCFSTVYAGVGTRSGVVGSYFRNIKILNNKFYKIKDKAIDCFNYYGSEISGNKICGASMGIIFEYYPASAVPNKLYMPNDKSKEIHLRVNANTGIHDNLIVVDNYSGRDNSAGIAVYGGEMTEEEAAAWRLPAGKYQISNLKIARNQIKVTHPSSVGIWLEYVKKSKIYDNNIRATKDVNGGVNAITSNTSWCNTYYRNKTVKFDNSIAFRNYSVNNSVRGNTFRKPRQYGVAIDTTSFVKLFRHNSYQQYGKGKVYRAVKGQ